MRLSNAATIWLSSILNERFGHAFNLTYCTNRLVMRLASQLGEPGEIVFNRPNSAFLYASSDAPCALWDANKEGFSTVIDGAISAPCAQELPSPLIQIDFSSNQAVIGYDILGLTYWMLNRIEEIGSLALDIHQRFPAISSHAFKHDYLERPVVDEWLNILGQVIKKIWPQLELKQHAFSIKVSHDVDSPSFYSFKTWKAVFRMMGGSLLKRCDIKTFLQAPWVKLTARNKLHFYDPYNTFDWLMDVSEQNGLKSAFYFICGRTSNMDADYELEHQLIQELIWRINQRGHEVGLHSSYGTFQTGVLVKQEAQRLRVLCQKLGVKQTVFGGRMHYLRWQHPITLQACEDAGLDYDSTLGYSDRPGFRCGTCFEYPGFNPETQQLLKLRIRPLIVMECTVIDKVYLGLGVTKEAEKKILLLKENCRKVKGCFTVLWHNSSFVGCRKTKDMYRAIVS